MKCSDSQFLKFLKQNDNKEIRLKKYYTNLALHSLGKDPFKLLEFLMKFVTYKSTLISQKAEAQKVSELLVKQPLLSKCCPIRKSEPKGSE